MIKRHLAPILRKAASQFSVVFLSGPRQSGKTTLVQNVFKNHKYISLEDTTERSFAQEDPKGFLQRFRGNVILDEIQRVPDLLSHIQIIVDKEKKPGRFILTGSQQFLLLHGVSQSLAGRVALLELLPLSFGELMNHKTHSPLAFTSSSFRKLPPKKKDSLEEYLWKGGYPSLYAQKMDRDLWMKSYERTYVERDVREILRIGDVTTFARFLRLCAARSGQLLNLSSLGNDCGISHTTARHWLSILEASFLLFLLPSHSKKFSRRLIKSPKLCFLDTGLLCHLLRIRDAEELETHAMRGAIMETFIISEIRKMYVHRGMDPPLSFWRDRTGHEIDLLIEEGGTLKPIEIKSSQSLSSDAFRNLQFFAEQSKGVAGAGTLLYAGDDVYTRKGIAVRPWWSIG